MDCLTLRSRQPKMRTLCIKEIKLNRVLTKQEKKEYGKEVGSFLVEKYGKKKYYTPAQVKYASKKSKYDIDWHCWAMCLYTSPNNFRVYHEKIGEVCDYTSMKTEMVSAVTDGVSESWFDFDFDLSWFEWPDISLSDIFDFFD